MKNLITIGISALALAAFSLPTIALEESFEEEFYEGLGNKLEENFEEEFYEGLGNKGEHSDPEYVGSTFQG